MVIIIILRVLIVTVGVVCVSLVVGRKKTEEEQAYELEEQARYLKERAEKKRKIRQDRRNNYIL